VVLNCTVLEGNKLVPDLKKENFQVIEDGIKQTLISFQHTDLPVSIAMVVDNSGSMSRKRPSVNKSALDLIQASNPQDEAFVVNFSDEAYIDQEFTSDIKKLSDGLSHIESRGGTALYDAVVASADKLVADSKRPKQVLILITDGEDEGSTYKIQDAIEQAQKADAIIYSIAYVDYNFYRQHGAFYGGSSALSRMSSETGGRVFTVDRKHPLTEAFAEIQNEMRTQYAIGYTPANTARDGSYRKIEIRCGNKDQKVQARKGYYATPNSEAE